ncbi:hypothetical protein MBLNU230_g4751t1 [Neophaeotheca triangularis]
MEAAARGNKAMGASDYDTAIKEFTTALKTSPTSPDYLIKRSTAYQRQKDKDYASSLRDAENGVACAERRAKRELIVQAQHRRGIALFGLERYGDAKLCFEIVRKMNDKEPTLAMWERKTADKLAALPEGDEKAKLTIKETPDLVEESKGEDEVSTKPTATGASSSTTTATAQSPAPSKTQQTPKEKIRHEWYQNSETVYFTLFAKGVPKDEAVIDITANSLSISFPLADGTTSYECTFDPLYAPVDTDKSTTKILGTKVEVLLAKSTPGQKWSALESSESAHSTAAPRADSATDCGAARHPSAQNENHGPAYPTSSRSGPKNWDKITATGDEEEEVEGGDPANHFFKKLFKDSSPEVQRAMMKSYTESNGTALSTDWNEVSKGKVETSPPDGMEARKWGQ